ncbi:MAG: FecCD family ABC transporter permease [Coriobacteriales bacterium]|jgi:iron complex transport system permease protein
MSRKDLNRQIDERIKISGADNSYRTDLETRKGMRPESRRVLILGVTCVILIGLAMILPLYMFEHSMVKMTPAVFFDEVSDNINNLVLMLTGGSTSFETRFMGVVVCAVGGAALGLCGSTYQGAFNNPLAAPKTLGVMSGGALGALVWVLVLQNYVPTMHIENGVTTASDIANWVNSLDPWSWLVVNYGQALCTVVGCFVAVAIVVGLTSLLGSGRLSNIIVIVFGQVFSTGVTAVITFARYYYSQNGGDDMASQLAQIENYTMIGTYYFRDFFIIVIPIVICMVIVLALRNRLTLLSFGDDVANTMGINVNRTRYLMIAVCTLMTGLAISFCGHVAFLGFISAHISRRIVGPDFRFLLPASIFVGGGFITIVQWICESGLPFTSPYSAGPVCSILGACLFVFIILRQRGETSGAWR